MNKEEKKEKMIEENNSGKNEKQESKKENVSENTEKIKTCLDKKCPIHGKIRVRGRIFWGNVIKKHQKRVVIEFPRLVFIKKYERFAKSKTRIHAHLPECINEQIKVGDYIKIGECRPISKMIHFVVLGKENKK